MKNGKRPTLRQKKEIQFYGLDPANWLVERDSPAEFVIVHRFTGQKRVFRKGA